MARKRKEKTIKIPAEASNEPISIPISQEAVPEAPVEPNKLIE